MNTTNSETFLHVYIYKLNQANPPKTVISSYATACDTVTSLNFNATTQFSKSQVFNWLVYNKNFRNGFTDS